MIAGSAGTSLSGLCRNIPVDHGQEGAGLTNPDLLDY